MGRGITEHNQTTLDPEDWSELRDQAHRMLAIRVAIVNHRTTAADLEALLEATLAFGADLSHSITREAS